MLQGDANFEADTFVKKSGDGAFEKI